ncbi:hemolymph lipopolysaccharide-binding protein-like [Plodia interpunctella]|uniref:hemolymph lipopolysaccharide-binding protein-like n=1 Tax=Plodia interpunctella TaxID=58824 RepID=UPI002367BC4F|nr:hemolymph lipopolysaccharide-binding protein-like [Plodia interpunctella]
MRLFDVISIIGCAGLVQGTRMSLELQGYTINDGLGKAYKIMYHGRVWNEARLVCIDEGGKLAVPKTEKEFKFLQQLVRTMKYAEISGTQFAILSWLGINNIANHTIWVNVDGENINDSEFHKWAGNNGQAYSGPLEPHCAAIDGMNFGLRDFWCHRAQPFICEKTLL